MYDLENCIELEDLYAYSSEDLAEGYFGVDEYSEQLKQKGITPCLAVVLVGEDSASKVYVNNKKKLITMVFNSYVL